MELWLSLVFRRRRDGLANVDADRLLVFVEESGWLATADRGHDAGAHRAMAKAFADVAVIDLAGLEVHQFVFNRIGHAL